uniref:CHXC30 n=1 Tax=Albugo laibachii Nc14 TaxID=890382 RepID=F0WEI3_9STRA|nr:CHXC30 [Albugo laibachii Nc14]|eukprot:CCA19615.1 CHXC30 [Albugo laibachii Nc14]
MLGLRFYAIMIIALRSASEAEELSGIFQVAVLTRSHFSRCHKCLVKAAGVRSIYLLEERENVRVYWATGNSDILNAFVAQCNYDWKCLLPEKLPLTHHVVGLTNIFSQHALYKEDPNDIEHIVFWFMLLIEQQLSTFEGHSLNEQPQFWKHDLSLFMRKQEVIIPVFFGEKANRDNENTEANNDFMSTQFNVLPSLPILQEISHSKPGHATEEVTQNSENAKTAFHCFILPGKQDAVCHECLAMHSESVAIQTYRLMHKSEHAGELCVFPAEYKQVEIYENCHTTFCDHILALDPNKCGKIDDLLPNHHQVPINEKGVHDSSGETRKPVLIDRIIEHIALKRMAKIRENKYPFLDFISKSQDALITLISKIRSCIHIVAASRNRWKCIACILKIAGGDGFLIILSHLDSIIMTHVSGEYLGCKRCKYTNIIDLDGCQKYLHHHKVATKTYQRPSRLQLLEKYGENCIAAYHYKSRRETCGGCMRVALGKEVDHHIISATSFLLYTSGINSKRLPISLSALLKCHGRDFCIRIQMVPKEFCFEHLAFRLADSIPSSDQHRIDIFTEVSIPVGVWPPESHRIVSNLDGKTSTLSVSSLSEVSSVADVWPMHDNIAFVRFECAPSNSFDCVKCLMEHSEVFLLYIAETNSDGYLWMRRAPTSILKICTGKHCSYLSYDEHGIQIRRPPGLLQLTTEDNPCTQRISEIK